MYLDKGFVAQMAQESATELFVFAARLVLAHLHVAHQQFIVDDADLQEGRITTDGHAEEDRLEHGQQEDEQEQPTRTRQSTALPFKKTQ